MLSNSCGLDGPQGPALVAQGIEHRPPEPGAQVRILPGALEGRERDRGFVRFASGECRDRVSVLRYGRPIFLCCGAESRVTVTSPPIMWPGIVTRRASSLRGRL